MLLYLRIALHRYYRIMNPMSETSSRLSNTVGIVLIASAAAAPIIVSNVTGTASIFQLPRPYPTSTTPSPTKRHAQFVSVSRTRGRIDTTTTAYQRVCVTRPLVLHRVHRLGVVPRQVGVQGGGAMRGQRRPQSGAVRTCHIRHDV